MDFLIYSVEDDKDISHILCTTIKKQGYNIIPFYDGTSFLKALRTEKPNMILLDMMLPDISGKELLKKIRNDSNYDDIYVIIISANCMTIDKVDGLDLGADDYIEKPFDILELMSRVNSKVRRSVKKNQYEFQNIKLDLDTHKLLVDDIDVILTNKEFLIFSLLIENNEKVLTRDDILSHIWGFDSTCESRTVDMHIKSLRKKINDEEGKIIKTIYGVGYQVIR